MACSSASQPLSPSLKIHDVPLSCWIFDRDMIGISSSSEYKINLVAPLMIKLEWGGRGNWRGTISRWRGPGSCLPFATKLHTEVLTDHFCLHFGNNGSITAKKKTSYIYLWFVHNFILPLLRILNNACYYIE